MNKKVILLISLVFLIGFVVFVSAKVIINSQNYNVELNLQKGWNLILSTPILGTFEGDDYADDTIASDSEVKRNNIKAVYYYLRGQNKYLQIYPDAQEYINYASSLAREDESYVLFNSVWVYTDKAGTLKYSRRAADIPNYNEVALENGWNFLTITPEMSGKSLNEMRGSCNIEKAFLWDSANQQWGTITNLLDDKNILTLEGEMGGGFIVKLTDDCAFNSMGTEGTTNPPQLP